MFNIATKCQNIVLLSVFLKNIEIKMKGACKGKTVSKATPLYYNDSILLGRIVDVMLFVRKS